MKIGIPVRCQNDHKAVWVIAVDGLDPVQLGVPTAQKCKCPKHDIGMGYFRDGEPFVMDPPLIQTLHQSGELIAANATIAQQAEYIRLLEAEARTLKVMERQALTNNGMLAPGQAGGAIRENGKQ